MITVKDKSQQTLFTSGSSNKTSIEILCQRPELLSTIQNKQNTLIFYGYLDMEWQSHPNPASYLFQKFGSKLKQHLHELYGSFFVLSANEEGTWLANDGLGDFLPSYIRTDKSLKISEFADDLLSAETNKINSQRVAHFFALTHPKASISFFQDIEQMNPGELIELKSKHLHKKRYYKPNLKLDYKHKKTEYWAENLNQKLQQAIQLQTQQQNSVNIQLSGGLDSTLVMAMALEQQKEVHCHSYVFPSFKETNESLWLDSMQSMQAKFDRFVGEMHWPLKSPWFVSANSPMSSPYALLQKTIYSKVSCSLHKYLLSGDFADHLYTGYIYWMVDSLKKRPLFAIQQLFKSLKSEGLMTTLRQFSPKKWSSNYQVNVNWLNPEIKKQLNQELSNNPQSNHPHPEQIRLALGTATAQSSHLINEFAARDSIHIRSPFRDRRVVEFFLTAPAWVLGDVFNRKKLARAAGKNYLPESIIRRTKVTTLKPFFVKALFETEYEKVKQLINHPDASWHQYVQKSKVLETLNKPLTNPNHEHKESDCLLLWLCISYELWMQRLKNQI